VQEEEEGVGVPVLLEDGRPPRVPGSFGSAEHAVELSGVEAAEEILLANSSGC
jgi:hypothetical protein